MQIVPTEGQRRFAISGASITLLATVVMAVAAFLSIPMVQRYLPGANGSEAPAGPAAQVDNVPQPPTPAERTDRNPPPADARPLANPSAPADPAPTIGSPSPTVMATAAPAPAAAAPGKVVVRGTELAASPVAAPLKATVNHAAPDGSGGVRLVVTLRTDGPELRAYAPHTSKGHVRNWSITDVDSGSQCTTRSDWMSGLPVHNDNRDESLTAESKAVSAGGTTFSAGFLCDRSVRPGDQLAVSLEIMAVAADGRLARSSFAGTVPLGQAR